LTVGSYVYIEFMNQKTYWRNQWRGSKKVERDMNPRAKILKVISKNKLTVAYVMNENGDLKGINENFDVDLAKEHLWAWNQNELVGAPTYSKHNIWSWFQRDEVRNLKVMTKDELLEEYIMELI